MYIKYSIITSVKLFQYSTGLTINEDKVFMMTGVDPALVGVNLCMGAC